MGDRTAPLLELVEVMRRLRRECAWKAGQTHQTLARYLLEETYEVLEAIDNGDPEHLREELGDLLLQIYFHAAIAEEAGEYDVNDVAAGLLAKLIRRNPHVFGDVSVRDAAEIDDNWQAIKAAEKQRTTLSEGIPENLPALLRAVKVLDRLERAGIDPELDPASDALGERLLVLAAQARAEAADPEQELRRAIHHRLHPGG